MRTNSCASGVHLKEIHVHFVRGGVPVALAKASFRGLGSPYQLSFLPLVFPASQQPSYPVERGRNISNKTQNTNIDIGLQCPQKIISRPRNFEGETIEENNFSQHSTHLNFSSYLFLSSKL